MTDLRRKWRPPLGLVIGGTLAAVLLLPLVAIIPMRLFGNILGWWEVSLLVMWIASVATCVLGWLLWRLVLRPVRRLTEYARQVKAGGEAAPPQQVGTPEMAVLAQSVVDMGEGLAARARSMRAYTGHVTHELKSPLTALRGAVELLEEDDLTDAERAGLLTTVRESTERMESLLDDLRKQAAAGLEDVRGSTLATAAVSRAEIPRDMSIVVHSEAELPISPDALGRVLTQLAQNAARHGAQRMELTAKARELLISDDGEGVQQSDEHRLFEPFFTTARESGGTGMGLSIARELAEASGGRLEFLGNDPGAVFRLRF